RFHHRNFSLWRFHLGQIRLFRFYFRNARRHQEEGGRVVAKAEHRLVAVVVVVAAPAAAALAVAVMPVVAIVPIMPVLPVIAVAAARVRLAGGGRGGFGLLAGGIGFSGPVLAVLALAVFALAAAPA